MRANPRLVRTPCPGSNRLRFAAIGALNRYREVFDKLRQVDHAAILSGIAVIIRRCSPASRSLVPPIDINQSALLTGTPFAWLSLLRQRTGASCRPLLTTG